MMNREETEKEGGILDDFVFVKAFDYAMSNYKKMHKTGNTESESSREQAEDLVSGFETNATLEVDVKVTLGADVNDTVVRMPEETAKTENPPPAAEPAMEPQPEQEHQAFIYDSDEEFEKFVRDFQESEERNAKILEQYYAGGLNYHYYPFEASGHYAAAAYQPYYTSSATYPYGSYWYPLQPAWHYPQPHYAMFPPAPAGEDMVGKGIAAAQKAISSLRINADGGDAKTETGEGEEEEMTTGSATELHEVLNAWYTAGLYTGKYLTEQASLKNAN